MGKPIIGCTNGDISRIINNYQCGFCCKPNSVNIFKKILNKILKIKKKNTIACVLIQKNIIMIILRIRYF